MYYSQSQGILGFGSSSRFSDSPVGHEITDRSLDSFVVGFDFGRDNGSEGAGEVHWGGIDQTAMGENLCVLFFSRIVSLWCAARLTALNVLLDGSLSSQHLVGGRRSRLPGRVDAGARVHEVRWQGAQAALNECDGSP